MKTGRSASAALAVAFLACTPPRPSAEAWRGAWRQAQAAVPRPADLEGGDSHAPCGKLLVATRDLRPQLLPSPDPALDSEIAAWLEQAGRIGLTCPSDREESRRELRELAVLAASINAGLGRERGPAGGRGGVRP